MSIEAWCQTSESYWAAAMFLSFIVALGFTIANIFQGIWLFIQVAHEPDINVKWSLGVIQLTTVWSIFVLLQYFAHLSMR